MKKNKNIVKKQVCRRCILDSNIPSISFNNEGICNYCEIHDEMDAQHPLNKQGKKELHKIIKEIKAKGKGKKYNCIIGVSGGVDSTYCLYLAKKLGLRPLAVHMDNGWDSELAVSNIEKTCRKLGVDLETKVLDWEVFKELQLAFLKASIPEIETPTDLAIRPILCQVAAKEGISYIINGQNFRTEGKIPLTWAYADNRYINYIYKKFGKNKKLNNYPKFTIKEYFYYGFIKRIKTVRILQYMDYRKDQVKKLLIKELDWKDYGGKHSESIFTRFLQNYILIKKFNIDKRKIHISAEVRSGHLSRFSAFKKINQEPITVEQAQSDQKYILKKLNLTEKEFDKIMISKPKTFLDYPSYFSLMRLFRSLIKIVYRVLEPTTPPLIVALDHMKIPSKLSKENQDLRNNEND